MNSARLPVVLLWHMHQPQYRDALTGQYMLPWTYLHAIKDYTDMAAHLEENPAARAVVNFTPLLIEQLEEIARRIAEHLRAGAPLPDPVLALLGPDPVPADAAERLALLRACLRATSPAHDRAFRSLPGAGDDRRDARYARAHPLRLGPVHPRPGGLVSPGVDGRDRAPQRSAGGARSPRAAASFTPGQRRELLDADR